MCCESIYGQDKQDKNFKQVLTCHMLSLTKTTIIIDLIVGPDLNFSK